MRQSEYYAVAAALAQSLAESDGPAKRGVEKAIEHVCHALQVENHESFSPAHFRKIIVRMYIQIR